MGFLLFPFKILATIFSGLGKGLGMIVACLVAAFLTNWGLRVYAWNMGDARITSGILFWIPVLAAVLTLVAGSSKK
jgi:hypothetical protein